MRKFGLIGKSLDHSWSEEYFHLKFIKENIANCIYKNYLLEDLNGLRKMVLGDTELSGLNITIPYKIDILKYLDETDPVAEEIQAVNCLQILRKENSVKITGYNTDMPAFRESLMPLLREYRRKALVLGSGGAARAVCYALKELNIDYSIVSRQEHPGVLTYSDLDKQIITGHQVIINATPVGMFPNSGDYPPLPYSFLTNHHLLYDLIYNPDETIFLKMGRSAGAMIKNGLEMLQIQAELSWKIWN